MTIPSWLKAALWTAAQTFLATLIVAITGLLDEVGDWLSSGDPIDLKGFANVVFAAFVALVSGVLAAVHRAIKPPETSYTGQE